MISIYDRTIKSSKTYAIIKDTKVRHVPSKKPPNPSSLLYWNPDGYFIFISHQPLPLLTLIFSVQQWTIKYCSHFYSFQYFTNVWRLVIPKRVMIRMGFEKWTGEIRWKGGNRRRGLHRKRQFKIDFHHSESNPQKFFQIVLSCNEKFPKKFIAFKYRSFQSTEKFLENYTARSLKKKT